MRAITITLSLAAVIALSACGAFQTKSDETLTSGGKVRAPVATEMRFDAGELIERTSEAGCDIRSVKIEASKRKDEMSVKCRVQLDGDTKTTVITE